MKQKQKKEQGQKNIYLILGGAIILTIGGVFYFIANILPKSDFEKSKSKSKSESEMPQSEEKPIVIEENLVVPETEKITGTEAKIIEKGAVEILLMPKSEGDKVIVTKAVLTAKGGYDLAIAEAEKWSSDVKPVFIKSLGAVTLEGKSSQWQLVFSSKSKIKKGYEVIIQADQIVSKKEVDSTAIGGDLPINFKDSADAIKVLQDLPQFFGATLSVISLYYNTDGKVWRYTFSTSNGATSVAAQ